MNRGQRKKEKKRKTEGMKREAIRGLMAEEVREVRTRVRRMMVASNVANQTTMLLSATPRTQDPNHRRMLRTIKRGQNIILRDLC